MIRSVVRWIERPRQFENEELYERLGVLIAKKFILWFYMRVIRVKPLPWVYWRYKPVLIEIYNFTVWAEVVHLIIFIVMTFSTVLSIFANAWFLAFMCISVNVVTNLYPIFLQRYNRIRIIEVMSKMK